MNVVASTACQIAYIPQETLISIYDKALKCYIEEYLIFFSKLPLFLQVPQQYIINLIYKIKKQYCKQKQIIYKEKDTTTCVYIIYQGEFKMFKQQDSEINLQDISKQNQIVLLGKGEEFGLEELLESVEQRQYNVQCISETGSLLVWDKEQLIKQFSCNRQLERNFTQLSHLKANLLQERNLYINQFKQALQLSNSLSTAHQQEQQQEQQNQQIGFETPKKKLTKPPIPQSPEQVFDLKQDYQNLKSRLKQILSLIHI
eukprot:TRINITY_DN8511_c0_g1_i4.p1 TRINITY_DN8511_c0_g1~~TRINITY_DN8511_c0_g1_i4.p1  ORF type:complete len:258 (-),score=34.15 TRINITY_DN8511_c0_g1_i4:178-951(-)